MTIDRQGQCLTTSFYVSDLGFDRVLDQDRDKTSACLVFYGVFTWVFGAKPTTFVII